MSENELYAMVGRIKNRVATNGVALSNYGVILVNSYALVLKDLHDFAEKLPSPHNTELQQLLMDKEGFPEYVIRLCTPKEEPDEDRDCPDYEDDNSK